MHINKLICSLSLFKKIDRGVDKNRLHKGRQNEFLYSNNCLFWICFYIIEFPGIIGEFSQMLYIITRNVFRFALKNTADFFYISDYSLILKRTRDCLGEIEKRNGDPIHPRILIFRIIGRHLKTFKSVIFGFF